MYKFLLPVFFLMFVTTGAYADSNEYDRLFGEVTFTVEETILSNDISITYHGKSLRLADKILSIAHNSIKILNKFYENENIKDCRVQNLHIYHINEKVLNNRKLMSFLDWSLWDNSNIDAVYDGTSFPAGSSAIFIRSDVSSDYYLSKLISHEMTHFWQYRKCMELNEYEASQFESFYRNNRSMTLLAQQEPEL